MLETMVELIPTLGFPIVAVIALAVFIVYIYKDNTKNNNELIERLQAASDKREDKLYNEIAECREVNGKAIATITLYAEKLTAIQKDVSEIKADVIEMKAKN